MADSKGKKIIGRLGRVGSRLASLGHTTPQWKDLPAPKKPQPPDDARAPRP
jgi:hypothetical protein